MTDERPRRSLRRLALIVFVVLVIVATAAWTLSPLARTIDPVGLARSARALRDWPLAPLVVIVVHVLAGLVATPASLLIVATIVVLGPWRGVAWCEVAMLVSGSVLWSIGRYAARDTVARWLASRTDPRLARLDAALVRRGAFAVALLRMSPLPYSMLSVALGAAGVRWRHFAIGTVVGVAPFLTLMGFLSRGIDAWIEEPDIGRAALLAAGLGLAALFLGWVGSRIGRAGGSQDQ